MREFSRVRVLQTRTDGGVWKKTTNPATRSGSAKSEPRSGQTDARENRPGIASRRAGSSRAVPSGGIRSRFVQTTCPHSARYSIWPIPGFGNRGRWSPVGNGMNQELPATGATPATKERSNMEAKSKENGSRLEETEHLCVSPGVIETVPPEQVSAAVLRHLRVDGLEVREMGEKRVNDRVRSIARYGGRRSIHRSSE